MTQNILKVVADQPDTFEHLQRVEQTYPRCVMTLTKMDVHWNGNVPLCGMSGIQTGLPEGYIVGNINEGSLRAIWLSEPFKQYRRAHRQRDEGQMPICKGCPGM